MRTPDSACLLPSSKEAVFGGLLPAVAPAASAAAANAASTNEAIFFMFLFPFLCSYADIYQYGLKLL